MIQWVNSAYVYLKLTIKSQNIWWDNANPLSITHTYIYRPVQNRQFLLCITYSNQSQSVQLNRNLFIQPRTAYIYITCLPNLTHPDYHHPLHPTISLSRRPILYTKRKKKRNQRTAAYNRPPPCTRAKIPYITLGAIPIFSREIKSRARHVYLFTGERRPSYSWERASERRAWPVEGRCRGFACSCAGVHVRIKGLGARVYRESWWEGCNGRCGRWYTVRVDFWILVVVSFKRRE